MGTAAKKKPTPKKVGPKEKEQDKKITVFERRCGARIKGG